MRPTGLIALVIFTVLLAACSADIRVRRDNNFNYLMVTIPENEAARVIETILGSGNDADFQEPKVDLRPGEIVVSGKLRQPGSNQLIPGSLIVRLWAENKLLQAEITSIDFEEWQVSSEQLAQINEAVTKGLVQRIVPRRNSELQQVTIGDHDLSFTFRTARR